MQEQTTPDKTCPACCGSGDYTFRGRKKVEAEAGREDVETKYRCKACDHEWKVRQPVSE